MVARNVSELGPAVPARKPSGPDIENKTGPRIVQLDVHVRAPRDGAPETKANPFANPKTYVTSVEAAENILRGMRQKLAAAQHAKVQAESNSSQTVAQASAARDAKHAQATLPLDVAKAAHATRHKELQAPVDKTQSALRVAQGHLKDVTYPNWRQLDASRAKAETLVQQRQSYLYGLLSRLDSIVNQLQTDRHALGQTENGLTQARAETVMVAASLGSARQMYEQTRVRAPSEWELSAAYSQLQSLEGDYSSFEANVRRARDNVDSKRRELDRLLNEDRNRPDPPVVEPASRRTEPGVNGRPTPPAVAPSVRPTPPPIKTANSDEIKNAREALSRAERDLNTAESQLGNISSDLTTARHRYDAMNNLVIDKRNAAQNVATLESQLVGLRTNIGIYENNLIALENRINANEQAKPGAIADRDRAGRELSTAQQHSAKLAATPYDQGDPAKIAAAQGIVDETSAKLGKLKNTYTEGMKPPAAKVESEQKTYNDMMAPFEAAVREAQTGKANAIARAEKEITQATAGVSQGIVELNGLKKVSGWKKFAWAWPKWLFGHGFSVNKFWKNRPEA